MLLERLLRAGDADSAIEQGWFLRELSTRFSLGLDELARRFDRTKSWVSRRIALVSELPAMVQDHVREGAIGAHAAMKYLVPLARANEDDCVRLSGAIAPHRLSNRQVGELYATYVSTSGNAGAREMLLRDPMLVLEARAEIAAEGEAPAEKLLDDLHIVTAVARRAHTRLVRGAVDGAGEDVRASDRATISSASPARGSRRARARSPRRDCPSSSSTCCSPHRTWCPTKGTPLMFVRTVLEAAVEARVIEQLPAFPKL